MDKKDKKLLYQLDINPREKDSVLAKRLTISKQVVGYRIKRIISENIIRQFQTVLNISILGVPIWAHIYFKLFDVTKEKEEEIIGYLSKNKKVGYVALLGGRFDLSIVLVAKNIQQLDSDIDEIVNKFPQHLKNNSVSLRTFGWKFPREYLLEKKSKIVPSKAILPKNTTVAKIDEIDKTILEELTKNSRISIMDLSKKINQPFSTTRSRIKSLEKRKIISGYSILLDLQKIGYHNYKIFLKTKDNTQNTFQKLYGFSLSHQNVTYFMKTFGSHNYEMRIEIENQEKFQEIVKDIRSRFSQIIEEVETIIIFKELKEDFSVVLQHI